MGEMDSFVHDAHHSYQNTKQQTYFAFPPHKLNVSYSHHISFPLCFFIHQTTSYISRHSPFQSDDEKFLKNFSLQVFHILYCSKRISQTCAFIYHLLSRHTRLLIGMVSDILANLQMLDSTLNKHTCVLSFNFEN